MNKLAAYIAGTGSTRSSFAERIGISAPYLTQILNGDKRPSLDVAFRIEAATGGDVPACEWVTNTNETGAA